MLKFLACCSPPQRSFTQTGTQLTETWQLLSQFTGIHSVSIQYENTSLDCNYPLNVKIKLERSGDLDFPSIRRNRKQTVKMLRAKSRL